MIDFTQLRTTEEKLIALFLRFSPPMQQWQIIDTLKIGRGHFKERIDFLISIGMVEKFQDRRDTLYRFAENAHVPAGGAHVPAGGDQNTETAPQLTNVNTSKQTNVTNKQKDFYSSNSGPTSSALPADPAEPAAATKAPKTPRKRSEPKTDPKPADDAESPQTGPYRPRSAGGIGAAYGVSLEPKGELKTEFAQRLFEKDQSRKKSEIFIPGPIFPNLNSSGEDYPLYYMLRTMSVDGMEPVPGIPTIAASPFEAFELLVGKIHNLFVRYLGKSSKPVHDDVVHRVAFSFAKRLTAFETPEVMFVAAKDEKAQSEKKVKIWTPILDFVAEDFQLAGFGWRGKPIEGYPYWQAERALAKAGGFEPRARLFPSHHAANAAAKAQAEKDAILDAKMREENAHLDKIKREQGGAIVMTYRLMSPEESEGVWGRKHQLSLFKDVGNIMADIPGEPFLGQYRERYKDFPDGFKKHVADIVSGRSLLDPPEGIKVLVTALKTVSGPTPMDLVEAVFG